MSAAESANAALKNAKPLVPRATRGRWLLALARRCYSLFLRLNGWRSVLLPSPLKGHGLVLKWTRRIEGKNYALLMEEALKWQSDQHHARQRVLAARATAGAMDNR